MSVIQLNNGEVHNVFELKDIKDLVDKEVYEFIIENTAIEDNEELHEARVEIDDLESELGSNEERMRWVYNHLDDLLCDLDDIRIECEEDYDKIVRYIEECKSSLE